MIKVTILGCGSSLGVPVLACSCSICHSKDEKNKRMRSSILISIIENNTLTNILVDCGFDIKKQLMQNNITQLDGVILTHSHADHISGIDELRVFCGLNKPRKLPIYLTTECYQKVAMAYNYLFDSGHMSSNIIDYYDRIIINKLPISFFKQNHVVMNSLGIRMNNFVYANDVAFFYEESESYLHNIETLVVDCCDYQSTNVHAGLERVLIWWAKYNPKQTYLTNLSHKIDYNEIIKILPNNILPSYDGISFNI